MKQLELPFNPQRNPDYLIYIAYNMEERGGHFVTALARAYYAADSYNRRRLVEAFQDIFEEYAND